MATIARIPFSRPAVDQAFWPGLASEVDAWARTRQVALRDAVLLVPYAQLLAPARRAFAQRGGWQPRIETTATLAASLAPPAAVAPGQLRLDAASDRLTAAALLRRQGWGRAWSQRDPRAFDQALAALVGAAHALARADAARAPHERDAHRAAAREALVPKAGPGASEGLLARVAFEWGAASDGYGTDVLFGLRPSAWMILRAGGGDPLAEALLQATDAPALVVEADPDAQALFGAVAALPPPRLVLAEAFEDEAQAAALEVVEALRRGDAPVALIAHDRVLVRRVRALLERTGAALRDETGWKLSTTRAAAHVMALLRACHPRAGPDDWLDWLKGGGDSGALASLEASWRRDRAPGEAAQRLWDEARQRLARLAEGARQPLAAWLAALRETLPMAALAADEAGAQVLAVLRLDGGDGAWQALAAETRLDLGGFTAWVDAALEDATFVPPGEADAPVVITPLSRAPLRAFGAVVFAGTDERRLGAPAAPVPLLGDALARRLGVPDAEEQQRREALAFAQVLRVPRVVLLRRAVDGDEPLAPSPLVERALLARRRAGAAPASWQRAAWPVHRVARAPVSRPAPSASAALPAALSASTVEALRACPYRFFARAVLGLGEVNELDAPLHKRDYGSWLHEVLHRFHEQRAAPADAGVEVGALLTLADALQQEHGLDAAGLLPYRVALEQLAPLYVQWLHERDVQGFEWHGGELERDISPAVLSGTRLRGRLDRIDRRGDALQLIDYKTAAAGELRRRVADPLEDTQLAFYAALVRGETDAPLHALYLALDERKGPQEIVHDDVAASAQALIEGLAHDLARIRAGAGLAALGEGRLCDFCEARGLCRRDHWEAG